MNFLFFMNIYFTSSPKGKFSFWGTYKKKSAPKGRRKFFVFLLGNLWQKVSKIENVSFWGTFLIGKSSPIGKISFRGTFKKKCPKMNFFFFMNIYFKSSPKGKIFILGNFAALSSPNGMPHLVPLGALLATWWTFPELRAPFFGLGKFP